MIGKDFLEDSGDRTEATRPVVAPDVAAAVPRYRLVVVGEGAPLSRELTAGDVLVGRSTDTDVQVEDSSLSRRHAVFSVGARLAVADLGSLNGTRVRGVKLKPNEPVEIAVGEVVELGSAMVFLQRLEPARAPRRLWPHGYFDARLEEECQRAERAGRRFCVVRLRVDARLPDDAMQRVLDAALQVTALVAHYSPREFELILEDGDADAARALCARVAAGQPAGAVTAGWAVYPEDGRFAASLVERAGSMLRAGGGGAAVVTQEETVPPPVAAGGGMERLRALVERVAQSNISVILQGETGVGKEVTARLLHRSSRRAGKPFVALNCGALTETLLESELFGHEKGAFTGADRAKAGLFEAADGGTVFLDEVAEMPPSLQVKLLRVLEERAVLRVGAVKPRAVDVRILAATHRNLDGEVASGRFRQDLYYRLNGIMLSIPPLRERLAELPGLVDQFAAQFARTEGRATPPRVDAPAMELLRNYAWPGNIRELRNVVERAITLCGGDTLTLEHLPVDRMGMMLRGPAPAPAPPPVARPFVPPPRPVATPRPGFEPLITSPTLQTARAATGTPSSPALPVTPAPAPPPLPAEPPLPPLRDALKAVERERILDALNKCGGNQSRAAEALGMSRRALVNRLEEFGLPRPRKREG